MGYILPKSEALRQSLDKPRRQLGKTLLTIPETCDYLRVSRWSVYRLLNTNKLKSLYVGHRRLIPQAEVDNFIMARLAEGAA